ncbi:MAG: right-handed parallel beta-helix repeat-containing protein [Candidatus Hydrogenedentes bacterium]|nr:right-handed parallel beta-helix repeat-containing protein [Candidatus Hydrogenedentota bacterium]
MTHRASLIGWGCAVVLSIFCLHANAIVYVSLDGDGSTGETWDTAFLSIEDALDQRATGEAIYVAKGTYIIGSVLALPSDIEIVGGFSGEEKGGPGESDPEEFPTLLDGSETAGSIFLCSSTADVVIEGFTLTGCIGGGSGYYRGGAIRVDSGADVEIHDCRFVNNDIDGYGGGVNVVGANAEIEDCVFDNNSAQEGGGVKVHSGSASLRRCVFVKNKANLIGGAFSGYDSDTEAIGCIFLRNDGPYGGAAECHEGTRAAFVNCLFARNTAEQEGGAITLTFQSGCSIVNCTIAGNSTEDTGGGVFMHDSEGSITNCVFSKNNSHAIFENSTSTDPIVTNCLFDANPDGAYFNEGSQSIANASGANSMNTILAEADGNLDGNPKFANPKVDDYHLTGKSPAIDAGVATDAPDDDIDGDDRPIAFVKGPSTFDIGYDEYNLDATITVKKPRDGDKWKRGDTVRILWDSDGYTGSSVRIELLRNGEVALLITKSEPNTGVFEWTIPDDVPTKKGYSIRITNADDKRFKDESEGTFRIAAP